MLMMRTPTCVHEPAAGWATASHGVIMGLYRDTPLAPCTPAITGMREYLISVNRYRSTTVQAILSTEKQTVRTPDHKSKQKNLRI